MVCKLHTLLTSFMLLLTFNVYISTLPSPSNILFFSAFNHLLIFTPQIGHFLTFYAVSILYLLLPKQKATLLFLNNCPFNLHYEIDPKLDLHAATKPYLPCQVHEDIIAMDLSPASNSNNVPRPDLRKRSKERNLSHWIFLSPKSWTLPKSYNILNYVIYNISIIYELYNWTKL